MQPPFRAGNQKEVWINYYHKFKKPIRCSYDGATAAIGDAEKGHLFLLLMTNQATASQPAWIGEVRVTFRD